MARGREVGQRLALLAPIDGVVCAGFPTHIRSDIVDCTTLSDGGSECILNVYLACAKPIHDSAHRPTLALALSAPQATTTSARQGLGLIGDGDRYENEGKISHRYRPRKSKATAQPV